MRKKLTCVTILALVLGSALAASATQDPIGWWKFDETSGMVAADSSGSGLNGALLPNDPNDPTKSPVWAAGQVAGALKFDGVDDAVDLGSNAIFNPAGSFTISYWANVAAWGSGWGHTMMGKRGEDGIGWQIRRHSNTRLCFTTRGQGNDDFGSTMANMPLNQWIYITCIADNAAGKKIICINGLQDAIGNMNVGVKVAAASQNMYIGCRSNSGNTGRESFFTGLLDDVRYYDRALAVDEAMNAMNGGPGYGVALNPTPANGATDVWWKQGLSFVAATGAKTHDVYFGTDKAAVTDATSANPMGVLVSPGQTGTTFNPGNLTLGAVYYWRVDEVGPGPDFKVEKGNVWSFTVEPVTYSIAKASITVAASSSNAGMGPEKTIDGSGMTGDAAGITETDMWLSAAGAETPAWISYTFNKSYALADLQVWNSNQALESMIGYGAKSVTVQYGPDANTLTKLGDFTIDRAPGAPTYATPTVISFAGKVAKYVKITINSNWGGIFPQFGLSEVRFSRFPYMASYPVPADGTTNLDPKLVTMSWRPGRLAAKHEVHLGIDQKAVEASAALAGTVTSATFSKALELDRTYYWKVNEVNGASVYPGDVWSFKTLPYYTLYNFGDRALKFGVGNARAMTAAVTDWTLGGATTLVITFTGAASNAPGQVYIQFAHSQNRFYVAMPRVQQPVRTQWNLTLSDLAKTGLNLKNVPGFTIGVLSEGSGTITLNNILLYRAAPAVPARVDPGTNGLALWYKMEGDVKDSSGKGLDGTLAGAAGFVDSKAGMGKALDLNGTDASVSMPIGDVVQATTNMTVTAWVNWTNTSMWARSWDFGTGTNNYIFQCPRSNNNKLRVAIRTPAIGEQVVEASVGQTGTGMPAGWHQIGFTMDASVTPAAMTLYQDGVPVGTGTSSLLPKDLGSTTQNYIGKSQWPDPLFKGQFDDFRIYQRVLTEGEFQVLAGYR